MTEVREESKLSGLQAGALFSQQRILDSSDTCPCYQEGGKKEAEEMFMGSGLKTNPSF